MVKMNKHYQQTEPSWDGADGILTTEFVSKSSVRQRPCDSTASQMAFTCSKVVKEQQNNSSNMIQVIHVQTQWGVAATLLLTLNIF